MAFSPSDSSKVAQPDVLNLISTVRILGHVLKRFMVKTMEVTGREI